LFNSYTYNDGLFSEELARYFNRTHFKNIGDYLMLEDKEALFQNGGGFDITTYAVCR